MKTINDLNNMVSLLNQKEFKRNDNLFKYYRTLSVRNGEIRLVDDNNNFITNCYLIDFIKKIIIMESESILKKALELEEEEYYKLLKEVKETSMEFATGMSLKIE